MNTLGLKNNMKKNFDQNFDLSVRRCWRRGHGIALSDISQQTKIKMYIYVLTVSIFSHF